MPSGRLRFPRASRIKKGGDFLRLKARGERVVCGCLIANLAPRADASASRLGVITSRKIGGAVQRSRARRLLREAFRLHQNEFPQPLEIALIARNSIAGKKLKDVERDFLQALRRAKASAPSQP